MGTAARTEDLVAGQTIVIHFPVERPQMVVQVASVRTEGGWTHLAFTEGGGIVRRARSTTEVV